MTIIVIAGGLSHERDVSLRSGRRVAKALRETGRQVIEADVNADLVPLLHRTDDPVVVPMLHGGLGEDGALREVLGVLKVPFVGPNGASSRLTFDKSIATSIVRSAGIDAPLQIALPHDIFRELGAPALMDGIGEQLGYPLIVKPSRSGSALGVTKVEEPGQLASALVAAYAYGPVAVIEQFLTGTEVAVTVLDIGDGPRALPPVEIRPESGVYDYESRYTAGATRFVTPAELDDDVLTAAGDLAVAAHRALGLRDISRIDVMVVESRPYFLEGNVAPGMTETSLAPLAMEADGTDVGHVYAQLVDRATARAEGRG
ncbi:D-alanine--D-alanine ligase family protein [Tessaracoccus lacteus]|uniref:D-alanine--D-alanine ligase n=1 Tax=Tessaracoccus lacteus TaxID=3041766 RepID=A0ABY8PXR4_9ACTN|nr:D-alanine--D-alanine ligase [Tessaracoccus sp. T21]WGT47254.1 D-alanine--D-alanine ligase [Tessaracoccus sp. T21]